jgi:signal transduction histidine kinase/HPt (histidine-containing phosphotransfer) domain-containing protein/ActR/RegA family two-component response regulator
MTRQATETQRPTYHTLLNAVQALSRRLQVDALLECALDELQQLVPYDAVLICRLNDEQGQIVAYRGLADIPSKQFELSEYPLLQQVVRKRGPVVLPDACSDRDDQQGHDLSRSLPISPTRREETNVWMGVPLIARHEVTGAILLSSPTPSPYDEETICLVAIFAHQIAIALENARLYEEKATATEARSSLLTMMSHKVRTPMNGIIGMASLLLDTELTAEQRHYVETIRISGDSLLAVINDIIAFSIIEAGQMELKEHPFKLQHCVEEAVKLLAPEAVERDIGLFPSINPNVPPLIIGDSARLRQVLVNLISNAIKFTKQGQVSISVTSTSQKDDRFEIQFAVQDTGIGIPKDRLNRLFQPFSQVDTLSTRKHGGTGLGLVISKRLVELMGGRIWVESEEGKGSTFSFTIQAVQAPEITREVETKPKSKLDHELAERLPLQILVADDSGVSRKLALAILQRMGYTADAVTNGLDALDMLRMQDYDIIFMDVQMPEMDGLEATRHIVQNWPADRRPRIIAMTANVLHGDRERCLEAGMDDYIGKPIRIEEIQFALERWGALQPGQQPDQTQEIPRELVPEPGAVQLVLDMNVIDEIRDTFAEKHPNLVRELAGIFIEDSTKLVEIIKQAVEEQDSEKVTRAAHSLKGISAQMGAAILAQICDEIELKGEARDLSEIDKSILQMERVYRQTLLEMSKAIPIH